MTLSPEKMFEHNLDLTKQRLLEEISNPEAFDWIPQHARIINLPNDEPELLRANLELAFKLVREQKGYPVVLIPEPGFEMPWQELLPLVSDKRIIGIEPVRSGVGLKLTFDDGSQLMLVATRQLDQTGNEQLVISIGMHGEVVA